MFFPPVFHIFPTTLLVGFESRGSRAFRETEFDWHHRVIQHTLPLAGPTVLDRGALN
jgi:hypothetical protein